MKRDQDPGVPGAAIQALRRLEARVGWEKLDRVWVFPPIRTGRKETGVVAAGCFADAECRVLVTLAYRAEETGRGISFDASFQEQGEAPPERIPRIMEGVVRRMEGPAGDPRGFQVSGDADSFQSILQELESRSDDDLPGRRFQGAEPT